VANFVAKSGKGAVQGAVQWWSAVARFGKGAVLQGAVEGAVQGAVAAAVRWRSLACIIHSPTNLAGRGLPLRNLRSEGIGSNLWRPAVPRIGNLRLQSFNAFVPAFRNR